MKTLCRSHEYVNGSLSLAHSSVALIQVVVLWRQVCVSRETCRIGLARASLGITRGLEISLNHLVPCTISTETRRSTWWAVSARTGEGWETYSSEPPRCLIGYSNGYQGLVLLSIATGSYEGKKCNVHDAFNVWEQERMGIRWCKLDLRAL
jgi:hypothetical protein